MKKEVKCKVCGKVEDNEDDLEIYHRGCRLGQLFKRDRKTEKELGIEGSGLKILNLNNPTKKGKPLCKALRKLTKKDTKE